MPEATPLLVRLQKTGKLSESEQKLAVFFENQYPQVAFNNLEDISRLNNVSKATVTRFIRRLGYQNFKSFTRHLQDEVAQNFDSPLERSRSKTEISVGVGKKENLFQRHVQLAQHDLQKTLNQMDEALLTRVTELVSDSRRPLFLMSAATGRTLLNYFYLLARYHRPNIHLLGGTDRLAHDLIDIDANAVLLTTSFDRFPTSVITVMKQFHNCGADTVLLTNRRSSPLLRYAKYPLFIHSEAETIFKSRCSMLVLLETLVSAIGESSGQDNVERIDKMESLFKELNVFLHKADK